MNEFWIMFKFYSIRILLQKIEERYARRVFNESETNFLCI